MEPPAQEKQRIREECEKQRRQLAPHAIAEYSRLIIHRIQELEAFREARRVALYMACGGEVDLQELFKACWQSEKGTCIPFYDATDRSYTMTDITADTPFQTGRFGIREPVDPAPLPLEEIDLFLVPGVAFDREGQRLGRGGGHYDRLLATWEGPAAGIAYSFQIYPQLPVEPHDRRMNAVVTEMESINVF